MSDLISITSLGYFVESECYFTNLPEVVASENITPLIKVFLLDEDYVVGDRLTESDRTKPYSE